MTNHQNSKKSERSGNRGRRRRRLSERPRKSANDRLQLQPQPRMEALILKAQTEHPPRTIPVLDLSSFPRLDTRQRNILLPLRPVFPSNPYPITTTICTLTINLIRLTRSQARASIANVCPPSSQTLFKTNCWRFSKRRTASQPLKQPGYDMKI